MKKKGSTAAMIRVFMVISERDLIY